jgi:tetratricopeptide (TPR) repeat protein
VIHFRGRAYTLAEASALAVTEYNRHNVQDAADVFGLMLGTIPDDADTLFNRGIALRALRQFDEALACYDRAIAVKPDNAIIYNNHGNVLQEQRRYEEALASYDRAIALNAAYVEAYVNRGAALQELKRHDEALASYDRALALRPDCAEAHNNRGTTLQEIKRYEEALASYDRAIALRPDYVEALNNRANTLVSMGAMQEAEESLRRALALAPAFPAALYALTHIRMYKDANQTDVQDMQALLARPETSLRDKEQLCFSLGKIHDDCGRYDEAFAYYRLANQIRNASVHYDHEQVVAATAESIELFSKDFLARARPWSSDSRLPLFIVGMPRSGTTLLAAMLSNHPAIGTAGELPTIHEFTLTLPEVTGSSAAYPRAVTMITPAVADSLVTAYESRLKRDNGSAFTHIIDKHPLNFRHLGLIAMLFPNCHIIHCTRHPLDTALSNYFQRFSVAYDYSFDLRNIGRFYAEYARLMAHWRSVLPAQMIEIRYEDMIAQTEQVARRALDFLGLPWDARCLSPHTNPHSVDTASNWQVRQPIYTHAIARWQHYERHLQPLKEILRCEP